jgi:NADP-dependent 3-hydroxy acid dehydrogenase YdfG
MIGATSGIGKAMAEKIVQAGSKVTVVGRRKERLDAFVLEYKESVKAVQFDIGELSQIPQFAAESVRSIHLNHRDSLTWYY